jgi:hypothetical protein
MLAMVTSNAKSGLGSVNTTYIWATTIISANRLGRRYQQGFVKFFRLYIKVVGSQPDGDWPFSWEGVLFVWEGQG